MHHIAKSEWGCGVFSKHELKEMELYKCHPDAIAAAEFGINQEKINAISLYGKMIDGYAIATSPSF